MSTDSPKLELEKILLSDAAEIIAAREKAILIHHTKDIDAAGDEVELAVRDVLRRKLSQIYYVGHGHIVDLHWISSPQLDVIIADNAGAPILFQAKNGTQYFPYESVFAVGEIKSTYRKSERHIHKFFDVLARIRSTLKRESVMDHRDESLSFRMELPESTYGSDNPLFSFMLFVDGGDFDIEDIKELYASEQPRHLPNLLCLLNKGVVAYKTEGAWTTGESWSYFSLHPGLFREMNLTLQSGQTGHWYFNKFGTSENRIAANFGFFYTILSSFLQQCVLSEPRMTEYMERVFSENDAAVIG